MRELSDQVRDYIDSAAEPLTISEVQRSRSEPSIPGREMARVRGAWWRPVAAAVVCAAVIVGLVLAVRGPSPNDNVEAGPVTTATPDGEWPTPLGAEGPAPVVPDGWRVLDYEGLRFAVPDDWAVPVSRSCLALGSGEAGVAGAVLVQWGPEDGSRCSPVEPLPASVVTIEPAEPGLGSGEHVEVGTLSATRIANESCADCGPIYQLENGLQVTVTGPEADAVLATFTESGAHRALQEGPVAESSDWRAVDYEGIALRVPPDWAVLDLPGTAVMSGEQNPGTCGVAMFPSDRPARVSLGDFPSVPSCPFIGTYDLEAGEGLWIRPVDAAMASSFGRPIAEGDVDGLHVSAVRVSDEQRQRPAPVLDLLVRTESGTLWLTLGVGRHAEAARAIIGSLHVG